LLGVLDPADYDGEGGALNHGPWSRLSEWEQTTRSIDADGHWQEWITIDSLKEFYGAEVGDIIGVGLGTTALPGDAGHGARLRRILVRHISLPSLGARACAARRVLRHRPQTGV